MGNSRLPRSEVIGFDEFEGCLRIRLRSGPVRILDENGQPVAVSDPLIRKRLFADRSDAPAKPSRTDETWNPWRQGP